MNQTNHPSLASNAADVGVVFSTPDPLETPNVDQSALAISCVDMISKLENMFAKAKQFSKVEFIDDAAATARKMLSLLEEFNKEFLTGSAEAQAREEISRAKTASNAYDEVLKTRSLGNAILRTFWGAEENEAITQSNANLRDALIRACAATMYHAIMLIGFQTSLGKQIDQSTVVFVKELKESW